MKKYIFTLFICLFFILNVKALELNAKYAYIYNATDDKVIYELNSEEEVKVASMTKIMTAILVIENNKDLNKIITIKDEDLRDMYEYTTVGFQAGNEVTIKELLYGILLKSGADAVDAAVRVTSSDEEAFVNLMNEKAQELGLKHTHFSNPVGKDEDNYSSVHDIALIMNYCLKNKTFKEIISTNTYYIDRLDLQINGPLYKMDSKYNMDLSIINGGKSGYTSEAKNSLVSYSNKNNITYIAVVNYEDKYKNVLQDTVELYKYAYSSYDYIDYNIDFDIPIKDSKKEKYKVKLSTKLFFNKNYDKKKLKYKYTGVNKITSSNKVNSKLGKVSIYYKDDLIKEIDINLNDQIKYKNMNAYLIVTIISFFTFIIFIIVKQILKKKKKILNKKNYTIAPKVELFIEEENSFDKKINTLNTTLSVNLFFNTLNSIDLDAEKKVKYEKKFIDKCFQNIDFRSISELKDLYTKLKLYINDMQKDTVIYCDKLFKYCYKNYIDKK